MLSLCIFLSWFRQNYFFHWRMQYYGQMTRILAGNNGFKLNASWWMYYSLLEALIDVMWITCGLLWCFYQLFGLSFWRHPFTAADPLVSKWCNVKFLQICSDEETSSSTSWGWVKFQQIFVFKWKIPLMWVYFIYMWVDFIAVLSPISWKSWINSTRRVTAHLGNHY